MARRVLLLGATGTIGRATARALVRHGHEVVCFLRSAKDLDQELVGCTVRIGEVTDAQSLAHAGFRGESFDALVSCLASRNGAPADAWAVDYQANVNALDQARACGVGHVVLLSAICVQKPMLQFQHAKLAFERRLIASGLDYSILRPTAFFKSLSGQVDRVKRGKPFLVFGNGTSTSCKPISDGDLAEYIAGCLVDDTRKNRVLPIGGPGAAITPRQQAEHLFALLKRPPRIRQVPLALINGIVTVMNTLAFIVPSLAGKAELARIGRYYATESMLVLDPSTGRYDADITPSVGTETLVEHYARLLDGTESTERGAHAVF